jgi:photosystem II stability/assembly factor-like uncharacterized protein
MSNSALRRSEPALWTIVGGPPAGTVAALAIGPGEGYVVFAGTRTGLYRAQGVSKGTTAHQVQWRRLPAAPLEIISLGVSPRYAEDRTILAGTAQGLFISRDGGDHWQIAPTPMPDSVVLSFCFSPNYEADGIVLAGTLEDGVYYSDTWGERWVYRGFGLLDATVYSLSISPNFARDETVLAGTETALYYSYNGARAWKPLDFPEGAAPILSLALSPNFPQDQTIYAGTERQGLYRSKDLGQTWQKLDLPAACVNALAISPEQGTLLAATNSGLYGSDDNGQSWVCLLDIPDTFSMAVKHDIVIAGLAQRGAWLTFDKIHWQPFFTVPARSLTGMVLSPRFEADRMAFLYGSQEGIWRTTDAGLSWECLNEGLPNLDIRALVASPAFPQDRTLVAASADGVLLSEDAGDHWDLLTDAPASLVSLSPTGRFAAIGLPAGEVRWTEALKGPWQSVPGPWGKGEPQALAVDDTLQLKIALFDRAEEAVSIWEGRPGQIEQVLIQPARAMPVVTLWSPPPRGPGETWYASLDHQVWEFRHPPGRGSAHARSLFTVEDESKILTLTGSRRRGELILFACTGQAIYQSTGTQAWAAVHHFGDERAIAFALSPSYPDDPTAYVLLLGGAFCRGTLEP